MGLKDSRRAVLVVSANQRKAYPICRSLARMGFQVVAGFYAWRSGVFSRFIHRRFRIASPYIDGKSYVKQVVEAVRQRGVGLVVPVGFVDMVLLSKHRNQLPENVLLLSPEEEELRRAADKAQLASLCEKLGLLYPRTVRLTEGSWRGVVEELGLPLVVKGVGDAAHPQYAFTEEQLEQIMAERKGEMLAQEFVAGWGAGYFAVAHEGRVVAEYVHRRVVELHPSGGASLVACLGREPELFCLGRRLVGALKWTGAIMVEFRREAESGDYYVLEVNPKFWGSLELATSLGLDFPRYLVELMLGEQGEGFMRGRRKMTRGMREGCFAWLLAGLNTYLRVNPGVWLRMAWLAFRRRQRSDIHLGDPAELFFAVTTRLANAFGRREGRRAAELWERWRSNMVGLAGRLRELQALIFDLDGTLTEIPVDWGRVRGELVKRGLLSIHEPSVMVGLYQAQCSNPDRFAEMSRLVEEYEIEAIRRSCSSTRLAGWFQTLRRNGLHIGVVSRQSHQALKMALDLLGVGELVEVTVGRENGMGRRRQASSALRKLGVSPSRALMVGDTVSDVAAAAKLGMRAVGVTHNPYRLQQFIELGIPSLRSVTELLGLLQRLAVKGYIRQR